ncbi:MAG: hypothetical protein GX442_14765 [Candidatus Riflebacteria bacterium]|nr:hypothetical protein [Candidatus Riflebacteria bacterium]
MPRTVPPLSRWRQARRLLLIVTFLALSALPPALAAPLALPEYTCVVRSMVADPAGRLWLGSFGAGLWVVEGDRVAPVLDAQGQHPSRRLSRLLLDGHRLWVATAGEGLLCYDTRRRAWVPVVPDPGPDFRALHGLARDAAGRLLIGSVGSGAAVLDGGAWHRLGRAQGLGDDWINDIVPDADSVWFATNRGVFRLPVPSATPATPAPAPPAPATAPWADWLYPDDTCCGPDAWENPEVNVLLPSPPHVFLGTMADGAFRLAPGDKRQKIPLTRGSIQALLRWRDSLWVAGAQGLWSVQQPDDRFVVADTTGPWERSCPFKSLAVSPTGSLLAGTLDGRVFETRDGLSFTLILHFADGAFRRP